jgi:pyruvate dehydrogenase E1 component
LPAQATSSLFAGVLLVQATGMLKPVTTDIEALKTLDERLRWLSAWTIHHANHIRENADGLKVRGHQASCASMTAIMAALYFHALGHAP